MHVYRGFHHPGVANACALTIGNFDGVHRGHQAMLALLINEARHRGVPSCALTFEPHPRDYFAGVQRKPGQTFAGPSQERLHSLGGPDAVREGALPFAGPSQERLHPLGGPDAVRGGGHLAPARIATLRDKLAELRRCGLDQCVVLPFDARLSSLSPQDFIDEVLVRGLGVRYVLVGDDFRFGAKRAGDYAMLDAAGQAAGFDVARMNSYEVHNQRVSSSLVRDALARGQMDAVAQLLGRPYAISGHVVHGRKLGRDLGFRTLNLRFSHWKPAASGIFAVQVHGLGAHPLRGVANLGVRPSLDPNDANGGRVLLETHCLDWSDELGLEDGYGKIIRVELLHKLHDELKYAGLDDLRAGIARDCAQASAFFAGDFNSMHAETHRQTTRDRI